jgi:pimeloyl-ACP methyl ester carboxylesterase
MSRRSRISTIVAAFVSVLAVTLAILAAAPTSAGAHQSTTRVAGPTVNNASTPKPTIVLVHGAFADSSGWSEVYTRLTKQGYPVVAFSNPLRGPSADGEYLKQFLSTINGPVVLVGHSYGGVVITNAATGNPNVKALVYIAAYAPAEGESVQAANALGGGHTDVTDHLVIRPYPGAPQGDADAIIDPAWYPKLFCPDIPRRQAQFMGDTQRPGALAALGLPSGNPAWKTIPSYYMVANQDLIIPPEAERAMADRANAYTVSIDSSHVAMISHPGSVTRLILRAADR